MSCMTFKPHESLAQFKSQAEWVGLRYVREVSAFRGIRNEQPSRNHTSHDEGVMVEVLVDGHFGYCATADLSKDGLARAFQQALTTTRTTGKHKVFKFTNAQRPVVKGSYRSARVTNLDATSVGEITDCLLKSTKAMQIDDRVVTRTATAMIVQTDIHLFSSDGTEVQQNFNIVEIELKATAAQGAESQTRTFTRTGQWGGEIFDAELLTREGKRVAREALDLIQAENCPIAKLDLVVMPEQMVLQIHESIGHPLELDRILGDERNFAGWSFVKQEDFGRLQYGSKIMNVTFDPTYQHEFASYNFDDGGAQATKEFLIKDGILVRALGAKESQTRSGIPGVANFRAASWSRAPIDRMANINMEPGTSSFDEMISGIERGVLMNTNRSWSIDDYRNKFQFGCEWGQMIENGRLTKVVKNPNYRGTTIDFWNRMIAVGNSDLMESGGSPFCGKGEPSQIIRVGHAAPPCVFRGIDVFGGQS